MVADRAQHVAEVVAPALADGRWVVTDRFSASTLAYQGYGRGLHLAELRALADWATWRPGRRPHRPHRHAGRGGRASLSAGDRPTASRGRAGGSATGWPTATAGWRRTTRRLGRHRRHRLGRGVAAAVWSPSRDVLDVSPMTDAPRPGSRRSAPIAGACSPKWSASTRAVAQLVTAAARAGARLPAARAARLGQTGGGRRPSRPHCSAHRAAAASATPAVV